MKLLVPFLVLIAGEVALAAVLSKVLDGTDAAEIVPVIIALFVVLIVGTLDAAVYLIPRSSRRL